MLDDALAQLPVDPQTVEVIARTDSAGLSHGFLDACRTRRVRFVIGHRLTTDIASVLVKVPERSRQPAITAISTTDHWHPRPLRPVDYEAHAIALILERHAVVVGELPPAAVLALILGRRARWRDYRGDADLESGEAEELYGRAYWRGTRAREHIDTHLVP